MGFPGIAWQDLTRAARLHRLWWRRRSQARGGSGYRPSTRSVALGGVLAAFLAGCGGQTKPVTDDTSAPSFTPAASTTKAVHPVAWPVISMVNRSVFPIFCSGPAAGDGFVGTGFWVRNGVVTASHVVAACPRGATISDGDGTDGTVSTDDPAHDLALVTYQGPGYPRQRTDPSPRPLGLESRPAYVGEPLALLGIPAFPLLGNPFKRQVETVTGNIVATNRTQVLWSATGAPETLRDVIEVAVPRVVAGNSGGPAIDSAGKVVGVIEGSASGIATLTPVTDLASLH